MLVIVPGYAQKKKKETKKEKKERIARWVDEQCKNKTFFIGITRLAPKNGVAQNIVYGNDGYYAEFKNGLFSCDLPYIAMQENIGHIAYNTTDNPYLMSKNQQVELYGGWQEDKSMYAYQITFVNSYESNLKTPINMIIGIYQTGECVINAMWPGMDAMTYVGKLIENPVPKNTEE